jgi:hypothetical protein
MGTYYNESCVPQFILWTVISLLLNFYWTEESLGNTFPLLFSQCIYLFNTHLRALQDTSSDPSARPSSDLYKVKSFERKKYLICLPFLNTIVFKILFYFNPILPCKHIRFLYGFLLGCWDFIGLMMGWN